MAYEPRIDKTGIYGSSYWYSYSNIFYPTYQLPNCTCYAYGRWLELGYSVSDLGTGDAYLWYPNTLNKGVLTCSSVPVIGAIACWTRKDGKRGHVGIVEIIDTNGDLLVSMSGYQRPLTDPIYDMRKFFWLEREPLSTNYRSNWMMNNSSSSLDYELQGFIYPPTLESLDWIHIETDQYPNFTQAQKENNARLICAVLMSYGWCLEAIAAAIGNIESEGILNPGQCEIGHGLPAYGSDGIPTSIYYPPPNGAGYGLGLCGWTGYYDSGNNISYPNAVLYYAYTNSAAWYDGSIQCKVLDLADDATFQKLGTNVMCYGWIPTTTYPDSMADFRTNANSRTVAELAKVFLYNFEKPADPSASEATRVSQAEAWYTFLQNSAPVNPPYDPGTPTDPIKSMPIWAMIRYY